MVFMGKSTGVHYCVEGGARSLPQTSTEILMWRQLHSAESSIIRCKGICTCEKHGEPH